MKLHSTLLAAACTLALSASAATFTPGHQSWPPTDDSYDSGTSITLFDFGYSQSSSQNIYSSTELAGLPYEVHADGSKTVSLITSIEMPYYVVQAYNMDGEANITAYLSKYDDASFPLDGAASQWIDYQSDDVVSGTVTIDAYDEGIADAMFGGLVTVKLNLDTPYEYLGGGLLLTIKAENSLADSGEFDWFGGTYSYRGSSHCSGIQHGSLDMSGNIPSIGLSNSLPIINFTYETKEVAAPAGEETVGDPAVFEVGDYDGCSATDSNSPNAYLPVTGDHYDYSYAQVIYTPNELKGLYTVGENIVKADITDLTFKMANTSYDMFSGSFNGKVYIQKYDAPTFPIVDNKPQWIAYDSTVEGTFETEEFDMYGDIPEDIEVTATFNQALRYEGGSLLVTFVADCSGIEGLYDGSLEQYLFQVNENQSAVTASDSKALDNLSGVAENVSKWVPVLKLGYKPVTVASAVKPVLFENVELALNKVTVDSKKYNNLAISFDLVNAEADGKYDITLGNSAVGTVTGNHGVINFVAVPKSDLVLSVKPQAEGGLGGSFTVEAAAVDALFPAPQVEVVDKAAYAEYSVWENPGHNNTTPTTSTGVQLVAKFKFTADAPVATMKGTATTNQAKMVTGRLEPSCFADFTPAADYSDYEANAGCISYYLDNANEFKATVSKGELVTPAAKSLDVEFSINYPVLSNKTAPVLSSAVITELASMTGYESKDVAKDYDNGDSWGKKKCSAKFDFAAGDPEIVVEVSHVDKLYMHEDKANKEIVFYAPGDHKIHYNWAPDPDFQAEYAPARVKALAEQEIDWTEHDSNIYAHSTEVPGALVVKHVDADGNDGETVSYVIDGDGNTTGIEAVAVDNEAAPVEYFDLQGRRVASPSTGLYIIRQGTKVQKIVL